MERDPLRLAWKTSPSGNLLAMVLLILAGALLVLEFSLVRILVDEVLLAQAPDAPRRFLPLAIAMPAGVHPSTIVLFEGFALDGSAFRQAVIGAALVVPVAIGLLLAAVTWLISAIGTRVLKRLRKTVLDAVLRTSPSTRDEAAEATLLVGDALARESHVFGAAFISSFKLWGVIGLAVAFALASGWKLGLCLAVVLIPGAILCARRLDLRLETAQARLREGAAVSESFASVIERLPAIHAHATGPYETRCIGQALASGHAPVEKEEHRFAFTDAATTIVLLLAPLAVVGVGAWVGAGSLTPGTLLACALAASLAAFGVREVVQWQRVLERARLLLSDIARDLAALQTRDRRIAKEVLPKGGDLVAQNVSAYDSASGGRISGVTLELPFPSHVALVGNGDSGSHMLAALIGGQLSPSTGRLTYGGIDLVKADPLSRAQRIAFAGETVLLPGTLRDNLIYGSEALEDLDSRLAETIAITRLDRVTHARGLASTFNPEREPKLAASIVESRRAVQAALETEGLDRFVDPFDAARYNRHAPVGENLLFGKPVGDTFREDRLASHPFIRAILEAADLTKPLARMGLSIATSMIEIFAEIPDGHPLFARFSFFSAADRAFFQDLVARRNEKRRATSATDRERLIGLSLRYNESRHRLGLLDEAMQARILAARADFARLLPASLQPAIEFYDADRICTAASVQDNLLFGRIASDQAGADDSVQKVIRRVLTERGLDAGVARIGLNSPIDVSGGDLTLTEIAAIDLVRCLIREPDILVVARALDGLPGPAADKMVADLRRALSGRGLIVVTPEISPPMDQPPFDAVVRFVRGEPVLEDRIRHPEPAMA
ncbi:ABC transporter ATP-binding protein [Microvirga flavescens]|uniref:ABC transporter ATP-binding protein n=1 Tax=Microvirga flavescens TaxID=2249811 RepID=UPI000DDBDAC8|nr:ABC transporter ATP-binding protein [Microvirga flavescens]